MSRAKSTGSGRAAVGPVGVASARRQRVRKLPPKEQVALGRTIRTLRRRADLSQEALAAWADVGAKHLGEIERGAHDPRFTTILKLARALQLQPGELIAEYERGAPLPRFRRREEDA